MAERLHTRVKSGIRLDRDGAFWHDDERITHPAIVRAFRDGLERAPDGRYLVRFGFDWAYITVEDAPYVVARVLGAPGGKLLARLEGGAEEPLDVTTLARGPEGVLYARVKGDHRARFSRQAQADLAPWLVEEGDRYLLELPRGRVAIGDDAGRPPPRPEDGPPPPDDRPPPPRGP